MCPEGLKKINISHMCSCVLCHGGLYISFIAVNPT